MGHFQFWGEVGEGLFHVTIDRQAYQKNTTKLSVLPWIFTSHDPVSNAQFSATSQGARNSFSSWGASWEKRPYLRFDSPFGGRSMPTRGFRPPGYHRKNFIMESISTIRYMAGNRVTYNTSHVCVRPPFLTIGVGEGREVEWEGSPIIWL